MADIFDDHINDDLKQLPATQYDIALVKVSLNNINSNIQKLVNLVDKTTEHDLKIEKLNDKVDKLQNQKNYMWGAISALIFVIPLAMKVIELL